MSTKICPRCKSAITPAGYCENGSCIYSKTQTDRANKVEKVNTGPPFAGR